MSFLINRILLPLLQKQSVPCVYQPKKFLNLRVLPLIRLPNPYSFHSSSFQCKDTSDYADDPEMQELIKSMYEDFNKKREKDSTMEESDPSSVKHNEPSKNIGNFNENLSTEVQFSSDIIYDYDEERLLREKGLWPEKVKRKRKPELEDVVYKRGKTGVFDVEELVDFLKDQKALDIVVLRIPPEINYVDYMVIASGKSLRHLTVLTEHVVKLYKKKKNKLDQFVIVEGKNTPWVALDMRNIALHLMSRNVREEKDIETLWTVGPDFDDQCQQENQTPYTVEDFIKLQNEKL